MGTQTYSRTYFSDSPIDGTEIETSTVETTLTEGGVNRRFQTMVVQATAVESEHVLVGPVISIGTNSPNYNNIVSAKSIGGLVGGIISVAIQSDVPLLEEGTEIKCKVNTAAIPQLLQTATFTFKVTLFGIDDLS